MTDESTTEAALVESRVSPAQWETLRRVGLGLYAVLFAVQVAVGVPPFQRGVPLSPYVILVWLGAFSAIWSLGRDRREVIYAFFGWGALAFAILAYSKTRSFVDNWWSARTVVPNHPQSVPTRSVHNARWIISADRVLGFGHNPTVALQNHLYKGHEQDAPVWEALPALVYTSHFFVVYVMAIVQWIKNRQEWLRWVLTLTTLMVFGVVLYLLVPTAPPWLASPLHLVGDVHRIGTRGLARFRLDAVTDLWKKGAASANEVAAFPSLHAGFTVLVAAYFWRGARTWVRVLLVAYPVAMTFTLVYSGEHYLFDCLCGAALAVFTVWFCRRVERWWLDRKTPTLSESVSASANS